MDYPVCKAAGEIDGRFAVGHKPGELGVATRFITIVVCLVVAAIAIPTHHSFGLTPREKTAAAKSVGPLKPGEVKQVEKALLLFTNKERARAGLSTLEPSPALNFLARGQSRHMCDKETLQHESEAFPPGWRKFRDRLKMADLKSGAENVAYRTSSREAEKWAKEVVEGWMKSPPHKKNILNGNFLYLGVGIATCTSNVTYATQVFAPNPGRLP